ncbi:hypothetical protein CathTA2_0238 [Caldalkalibacillus thermarum TA2.A1]|uniref:MotA/TolQ/ExbB proton channel domain-containing protein n=1 Tax=Caldalkalibacillus thermarum (strain TA2.A1) TaxID=986075 RepID=F5L376_CALTT|nr:hypothetical protein [Caldalkalibacillus thermarum]EGL84208.1 hypothetical protein CathTA2_0238 [Caldalkalibacillus thermarum TA2.A1]QZT35078.1 hypothetical protein HUR95_07600 [Caldalkalibacillus thermarum TA2.A1]
MESHQLFYVVLGLIAFIGLTGMIGNIQLSNCYQKWLERLMEYETREDWPDQALEDELIEGMISEYRRHRSQGIEFVNTQAIVEKGVYERQLHLLSLFRLPVGVVERILHQLPSWAIIAGLLGTFLGLTMALFAMQDTLLRLGADSGSEVMSVAAIVAAISEPFRGMSFAFITSIAGIGTAFCLHVFHSGLFTRLGIGPSWAQTKNLFMTRAESFLDHQVQLQVQQEKPKDSLERLLDRLVAKVKESFDQSVKAFGDEILKTAQLLQQNIAGLEEVIHQSASFTSRFEQGTARLSEFGQVLERNVGQFKKQEEQAARQLGELSKTIGAVGQEFKRLTDRNQESAKHLQLVVERSDQLIKLTERKNEELVQFVRGLIEELQRHVRDMLEENRRQHEQNQDEWYYRFQEKNDLFVRAAESFSQAVQHLERQWEDGLERFKRELAVLLQQVLEKSWARQTYGANQEREWREMTRELESIQHLLEREFHNMHRFSQDIQHILLSMFEWGRSQMGQRLYSPEPGRSPMVREGNY